MCQLNTDIFIDVLDDCFNKSAINDFRNFVKMFLNINKWILTSDYCLNDKNKFNNVISFLLLPIYNNTKSEYIVPELGRNALYLPEFNELIKHFQKYDLKSTKQISKEFITFLKSNIYFSFNFILNKNIDIGLDAIKHAIDSLISMLDLWIENADIDENKEYYKRCQNNIKTLKEKSNMKSFNKKLFINMIIIIKLASYIKMILLREHKNIKVCGYISDRDKMTNYPNNTDTFYDLFHVYSHCICNHYVRQENDNLEDIFFYIKNNKFDADELIRIPDFFAGTLASFDYNNCSKLDKEKHRLILKDIICKNKNIVNIIIKSVGNVNEMERLILSIK